MLIRIIVFYLAAFFFTILLGGLQMKTGIGLDWITLPQLGPGLAAALMLIIFRNKQSEISLNFKKVSLKQVVDAIIYPLLAYAVVYLIISLINPQLSFKTFQIQVGALYLVGMLAGAIGEEIGWRGYFQKYLENKISPVASCLIVGILWALWHVGLYKNGLIYMVLAVISITGYTFVLYYLFSKNQFNIWIAAVFHFFINLSNLAFILIDNGERSFDVLNSTQFMLVNAVVWTVIVILLVMRNKDVYFREK
jgi:membrane protease YdiL (CAAX protease family)